MIILPLPQLSLVFFYVASASAHESVCQRERERKRGNEEGRRKRRKVIVWSRGKSILLSYSAGVLCRMFCMVFRSGENYFRPKSRTTMSYRFNRTNQNYEGNKNEIRFKESVLAVNFKSQLSLRPIIYL